MLNAEARVTERDLYVPALRAAERRGGYISTTDLIAELIAEFEPTGRDAEQIENRNDSYFSQKVRNIISHKDNPGNIIYEGYAEHVDDGLQITEAGRAYLRRLDG